MAATTTGTTGDDNIVTGSGSDTITDSGGSDRINAGSGSDTLIYNLGQNVGETDLYIGGSGWDKVRLVVTEAQWLSDTVQDQVALYFQHLETVRRNANTGEVSNSTASDFTFIFDGGTRLTVSMMEDLQVEVDGVLIDFEAPFTTDDVATVNEDLSVEGTVADNTTDINDSALTFSVVDADGNSTTLPDGLTFDSDGTYTFNAAGLYDHLDTGEQTTVEFFYKANDGDDDSNVSTVTITVTGVNDAPVTSDDAETTNEDTVLAAAAVPAATDPDDSVTYQLVGDVSKGILDFNADGTFSFDPNGEFEGLDTGDEEDVTFTYKANDGEADSNVSTVTITVTGVNDAPVVASPFTGTGDPNDFDSLVGTTAPSFIVINGTSGNDSISPNDGVPPASDTTTNDRDIINGLGGNDVINAGDATDQVYGGTGDDNINGGNQSDSLYGQAGNDTINGDAQGDSVFGGSGDDILNGNINDDTIFGGSGNDVINGGDGADTLVGGWGADNLTGGTGSDTYRFLDVLDTGDVISGYSSVDDTLDFSAIAGITGGASTSSSVTANSVNYFTQGTDTVIWADTDGNTSTVELQVTLSGVTASLLAPADFQT